MFGGKEALLFMIELLLNYFTICAHFPEIHVPVKAKFYELRHKTKLLVYLLKQCHNSGEQFSHW